MRKTCIQAVLLACLLILTSCQTKKEGVIEGSVVPPSPGVHITVSQSGKTVRAVDANLQDGTFRIALSPGTYDISVYAPASPFPLSYPGISVDPGGTAKLPPVEIAQSPGSSALSGTVVPGGTGAAVTLLYEGRERASVNATPEGKYEFTALAPGDYTVQATAPGYARDTVDIRISGDHRASGNMRLLYVSSIEGIDWTRGIIRAKGRGRFPANETNRTAMQEMAKRAALSEAERNLLRIVEQIKLDPNHDLRSTMTGSAYVVRIRGFLQGFKIVEEHEQEDGVEVELELPLTGSSGLTRSLSD